MNLLAEQKPQIIAQCPFVLIIQKVRIIHMNRGGDSDNEEIGEKVGR